jgi:hypothetical protein
MQEGGNDPGAPDTGLEDVPLTPDAGLDRAFEELRERPEARRDIAGDGGAGREEVRDVTDCVLSLWFEISCRDNRGSKLPAVVSWD